MLSHGHATDVLWASAVGVDGNTEAVQQKEIYREEAAATINYNADSIDGSSMDPMYNDI